MFVHIGIHHPADAHRKEMLSAMKHFARTAADQSGNLQALTIADQSSKRFAGITIWEDKTDFDSALPALKEAISGYPWDDWQTDPTDVWLSDVVLARSVWPMGDEG